MKKSKLIGSLSTMLMVVMVWGALSIMANPGSTYAFVTKGAECGLRVQASESPFVDVGNLSPGDKKGSYLTVYNDGENPLTYYMDIIRKGGKSGVFWNQDRTGTAETGAMLEDILEFTILRENEELFSGLLKDFKELQMGELAAGQHENIDVQVCFPGEEADNSYQGSSVTVQFAFRAECESGGGGGDDDDRGGGDTRDRPEPPDEEIEFEPQEEPSSPPAEEPGEAEPQDEELIIQEEDTPAGPGLPKTGELPPWLFYGMGLLLILAGMLLGRKYRPSKR